MTPVDLLHDLTKRNKGKIGKVRDIKKMLIRERSQYG